MTRAIRPDPGSLTDGERLVLHYVARSIMLRAKQLRGTTVYRRAQEAHRAGKNTSRWVNLEGRIRGLESAVGTIAEQLGVDENALWQELSGDGRCPSPLDEAAT